MRIRLWLDALLDDALNHAFRRPRFDVLPGFLSAARRQGGQVPLDEGPERLEVDVADEDVRERAGVGEARFVKGERFRGVDFGKGGDRRGLVAHVVLVHRDVDGVLKYGARIAPAVREIGDELILEGPERGGVEPRTDHFEIHQLEEGLQIPWRCAPRQSLFGVIDRRRDARDLAAQLLCEVGRAERPDAALRHDIRGQLGGDDVGVRCERRSPECV